jgi:hypothetical protein
VQAVCRDFPSYPRNQSKLHSGQPLNEIIVFTKLLKNKLFPELVATGQLLGLDGYDLCVRSGYLVNPESVQEGLIPVARLYRTQAYLSP